MILDISKVTGNSPVYTDRSFIINDQNLATSSICVKIEGKKKTLKHSDDWVHRRERRRPSSSRFPHSTQRKGINSLPVREKISTIFPFRNSKESHKKTIKESPSCLPEKKRITFLVKEHTKSNEFFSYFISLIWRTCFTTWKVQSTALSLRLLHAVHAFSWLPLTLKWDLELMFSLTRISNSRLKNSV